MVQQCTYSPAPFDAATPPASGAAQTAGGAFCRAPRRLFLIR